MALGLSAIVNAIISDIAALGVFDVVLAHEPKGAPVNGLSACVWVSEVGPAVGGSGLNSTSSRVALTIRLSINALTEPQDGVDLVLTDALDQVMGALSGGLSLSGNVRCVDLLGVHGSPLGAVAGYLQLDGVVLRIYTVTCPVIVNDVWTQGA